MMARLVEKVIFTACIMITVFAGIGDALRIIEPLELFLVSPSSFSMGARNFNVTGEVILADPFDACQPLLNTNESIGRILVYGDGACIREDQLRNIQASGALGAVSHEPGTIESGNPYYGYYDYYRDDIIIPHVYMNEPDGYVLRELIANSTRVVAILTSGGTNTKADPLGTRLLILIKDYNVWLEANRSAGTIIVVAIHGVINLGVSGFALYKYISFTRTKKTCISVAQVSLWLIIIAMLVGLLLRLIMLISGNNVFNIPGALVVTSAFLADTLILATMLIVSFYWFELTSKINPMAKTWSKKLWTPFMIGVALSIAMIILIALWAQYFRVYGVFVVILIVYAVITLSVAIIWIVFGVRLKNSLLKDKSKSGESNKKKFKKLIVLIILSACLLICTRIFTAFVGFVGYSRLANRLVFEPLQFFVEFNAIVLTLLFTTTKKKAKSSQTLSTPRSFEHRSVPPLSPKKAIDIEE